jgi:hypothetical protein
MKKPPRFKTNVQKLGEADTGPDPAIMLFLTRNSEFSFPSFRVR